MTDHYELFGVEPDASKDEIKAAYRSEVESADSQRRAELNRAWNVLSDPIQRQRYDESLGASAGGDDDAADESGGGAAIIPSKRATGARRGPDVVEARASRATAPATTDRARTARGGGRAWRRFGRPAAAQRRRRSCRPRAWRSRP